VGASGSSTGSSGATGSTGSIGSTGGSSGGSSGQACSGDGDCAAPTARCDATRGACVECLADADCGGAGFTCDAASDTCWQASCSYSAQTEPTSAVAATGCVVRLRDTSGCRAAREAQGIGGAWLEFSCRVTLTKVTVNGQDFVQLASDDRPDYKSVYYGSGDACYEADSSLVVNPNRISAQSLVMTVPLNPTTSNGTRPVPGSSVGLAVDGVALFSDFAAPGDDIYQEAKTFDRCQGHPQNTGVYHHHAEPFSITQDDDALVGVMRDGYFIYGRKDPDGSGPGEQGGVLTAPYYGHVGLTADSPSVPVFRPHVHFESNGTDSAYFITPPAFYGTVLGTCTNGAGGC